MYFHSMRKVRIPAAVDVRGMPVLYWKKTDEKGGADMVSLRHFSFGDAPILAEKLWPEMKPAEIEQMIADWNTLTYDGKYFEMFAIERDGALTGYVSLYEHSKSVVSSGIEVFESERKRGVAFAAMSLLNEHARCRGFRIIQDQVRADNTASLRLHEKLGFETDRYIYRNRKGEEVLLYLLAL